MQFCKHEDHWKAQCPKLRNKNQLQHQSQFWNPGNQTHSNANRPPHGCIPPQGYRPPQFDTTTVATSGSFYDPCTLAKQFQKFLFLQPQPLFASSSVGQLTHNSLGMLFSIWILDSSASHYMSPDSSFFTFMSHSSFVPVLIVDDTPMPLVGVGYVVTLNLSL